MPGSICKGFRFKLDPKAPSKPGCDQFNFQFFQWQLSTYSALPFFFFYQIDPNGPRCPSFKKHHVWGFQTRAEKQSVSPWPDPNRWHEQHAPILPCNFQFDPIRKSNLWNIDVLICAFEGWLGINTHSFKQSSFFFKWAQIYIQESRALTWMKTIQPGLLLLSMCVDGSFAVNWNAN